MSVRGIVLMLGLVVLAGAAAAGDNGTRSQGQALSVGVRVGALLEVIVPDGVSDLVRLGAPEVLQVEHVSGRLFITPVRAEPAELVVVDARGRSYRLQFSFTDPVRERLVLGAGATPDGAAVTDPVLAMVRVLARGEVPEDATVRSGGQMLVEGPQLRITILREFLTPVVTGMIARFENLGDQDMTVPYDGLDIPGLRALAAEDDVVAPGKATVLYLVVAS